MFSRSGSQNTNPLGHFSLTSENCGCVRMHLCAFAIHISLGLVLLTHFQSLGDVSSVQLAGLFQLFIFFSLIPIVQSDFCLEIGTAVAFLRQNTGHVNSSKTCSRSMCEIVICDNPSANRTFWTHKDFYDPVNVWAGYSDWSLSGCWAYTKAICLTETLSLLIIWKCLLKVRADKLICLRLLLTLHSLPVWPFQCASVSVMSYTDVQ